MAIMGLRPRAAVQNYQRDRGLTVDGIVGVKTWSSMGLIYRTKKDIDAGVEIVTIGLKQYFDVTKPVNAALKLAAKEANNHQLDMDWFVSKVDNKMEWDIKVKNSWTTTIKTTYPGNYNSLVYYYKMATTPEGLGNMMYGYTGAAAGFPGYYVIRCRRYGSAGWKRLQIIFKGFQKWSPVLGRCTRGPYDG